MKSNQIVWFLLAIASSSLSAAPLLTIDSILKQSQFRGQTEDLKAPRISMKAGETASIVFDELEVSLTPSLNEDAMLEMLGTLVIDGEVVAEKFIFPRTRPEAGKTTAELSVANYTLLITITLND